MNHRVGGAMLMKSLVHPVSGGIAVSGVAKLKFSGHQSFPLRFAWIPKTVHALSNNPSFFTEKDSFVQLGVGKNMAQSILHWCRTLGLVRNGENKGEVVITEIAELIFSESAGLDPYIEHDATLWLLHWMIAGSNSSAGTFRLAFSRWNDPTFTKTALAKWIFSQTDVITTSSEVVVKKDIDVMVRTYTGSKVGRHTPLEDSFDSPLSELGLLSQDSQESTNIEYRFNRGKKETLPPGIIAFSLHQYWDRVLGPSSTTRLDNLVHGDGAPGSVFKLRKSDLFSTIEDMPEEYGFSISQTAGISTVSRIESKFDMETLISNSYGV